MDRCHKFDITFPRQLSIWGSTFKTMVRMSIVVQNSEELVIITSCSCFYAILNERGRNCRWRLCERVLDYRRRRQDTLILDSRVRYCQHSLQKKDWLPPTKYFRVLILAHHVARVFQKLRSTFEILATFAAKKCWLPPNNCFVSFWMLGISFHLTSCYITVQQFQNCFATMILYSFVL